MNLEKIKQQAQKEINEELFRNAVEKEKERIRKKQTFWDKLIPFKIIVIKKEKK
jgi:hypothetical protein